MRISLKKIKKGLSEKKLSDLIKIFREMDQIGTKKLEDLIPASEEQKNRDTDTFADDEDDFFDALAMQKASNSKHFPKNSPTKRQSIDSFPDSDEEVRVAKIIKKTLKSAQIKQNALSTPAKEKVAAYSKSLSKQTNKEKMIEITSSDDESIPTTSKKTSKKFVILSSDDSDDDVETEFDKAFIDNSMDFEEVTFTSILPENQDKKPEPNEKNNEQKLLAEITELKQKIEEEENWRKKIELELAKNGRALRTLQNQVRELRRSNSEN